MSTGAVAAEYSYDSFGARTTTGAEVQRYGFTGREHDDESGLIYFRARHYDPVAGQFIQLDPIEFGSGETNFYSYVWENPYNWKDPSGLTASMSCSRGAKMGGACGSMAGLMNPVFNAVKSMSVELSAVIAAAGVYTVTSDDDDANVAPYMPAVCNNQYFDQRSKLNPGSMRVPPSLFAQATWLEVLFNPSVGDDIGLSADGRFCRDQGWMKMQYTRISIAGEKVTFHYQWNPALGIVSDIKVVHWLPPKS